MTQKKQQDVVDYLLERAGDDAHIYTANIAEDKVGPRETEGELAVDILDQQDHLVVVATVAGADPNGISVNVHDDVLTIRGKRDPHVPAQQHDYVHRECFWGKFSRTIILPFGVKEGGIKALYRNGVLVVSLPKKENAGSVPITVVDG